jgi:hypothetical protein
MRAFQRGQAGMKVLLAAAVAYYALLSVGTRWMLRDSARPATVARLQARGHVVR